ncbi:MAG: adenylate kinase family protein [Thermoplasmatota archaeon]
MIVALSGTPGTGKTAISTCLQKKGFIVIRLNELALKHGFIYGYDNKRKSKILDIEKLNIFLSNQYSSNELVIIEGHATHLLHIVEKVILLRCHPKILKKRLEKKGWGEKKIRENVDAEALDIILCEAIEYYDSKHIFEIDTSNLSIESVCDGIIQIFSHNFKPIKKYNIGKIDWSDEAMIDL